MAPVIFVLLIGLTGSPVSPTIETVQYYHPDECGPRCREEHRRWEEHRRREEHHDDRGYRY